MKNKSLIVTVIITIALIGIVVFAFYNKTGDNNGGGNHQEENKGIFNKNAKLEDIVHDDRINIYFFWGDGCPHCKEEYEWFEYNYKEYGQYFNLYGFETWYHSDNAELLNKFAGAMGESVSGVPYTIIGDKSYTGFATAQHGMSFLTQILNAKDNKFDVYFDKIKGSE